MRVTKLLTVATLLFASLPSAPAFAADPEPIEGTWEFSGGGAVRITPDGDGSTHFTGVVTRASSFSACVHPVGQTMWDINGSGTHYTGDHIGWQADLPCRELAGFTSTWDVTETADTFTLTWNCTTPDGSTCISNPATFKRLKPPQSAFQWTMSMKAAPDRGAPGNGDYVTTTASAKGDFEGIWQDGAYTAKKLDGLGVDALYITLKDVYLIRDDQATRLRILRGGSGRVITEGGFYFGDLRFNVKVVRSEWRLCPKGEVGTLSISNKPSQVEFDICGRDRSYINPSRPEDGSLVVTITKS